jgi:hypothetical protein
MLKNNKVCSSNLLLNNVKSHLLLGSKVLKKSFSSTSSRKADPLSTTVLAFGTPYDPSFLCSPAGGFFIMLVGLGTALFFLTQPYLDLFSQASNDAAFDRFTLLFSVLERYVFHIHYFYDVVSSGINAGMASPEQLRILYPIVQELITILESIYSHGSGDPLGFSMDRATFIRQRDLVDVMGPVFEQLRLREEDLVGLLRNIENRLNIPENERVPSFSFEG